jgi:hypothetical protein
LTTVHRRALLFDGPAERHHGEPSWVTANRVIREIDRCEKDTAFLRWTGRTTTSIVMYHGEPSWVGCWVRHSKDMKKILSLQLRYRCVLSVGQPAFIWLNVKWFLLNNHQQYSQYYSYMREIHSLFINFLRERPKLPELEPPHKFENTHHACTSAPCPTRTVCIHPCEAFNSEHRTGAWQLFCRLFFL